MEPKKVTINYALLCKQLEKRGKTKKGFSLEMGRSESFVNYIANNPDQPEAVERIMCLLLGLEPGSLVKEPEKKGMTAAQALTVIRDEILENRRIMQENFEKIWNKLNANTIQLEKIKDKVNEVSKTDYDKAVEWLKDKMAGGRYDGAKLLMESDAAGIKRSDVMKARNELKIKIQTTGYGKNVKAWWSLERE
jgi:hypothetical protein|nr:MAG TPA: hypothetical protein [Caudoviricetes sp.]